MNTVSTKDQYLASSSYLSIQSHISTPEKFVFLALNFCFSLFHLISAFFFLIFLNILKNRLHCQFVCRLWLQIFLSLFVTKMTPLPHCPFQKTAVISRIYFGLISNETKFAKGYFSQ